MTDLENLIPQPQEITVNGESLAITPLKVGQLPGFLRAITPVMQHLSGPQIDWLALFGQHGEDLLGAMAIAVNKPRTWVDALPADAAIVLCAKVMEVNADFFTRMVLPQLDGLFAHIPKVGSQQVNPATPSNPMANPTSGLTPPSS